MSFVAQNFDKYAEQYEKNARIQRRVANELLARCKNYSGKILDIGAGIGAIRQMSEWPDVTEIDSSAEMCRLNGKAICANAEEIPFPENSFDNAISSLAFQWVDNKDKALEEVFRVLKPGGKFTFSTFTTGCLKELETSFSFLDKDKHMIDFEPAMRLFAIVKKAGFSEVAISAQTITYYFNDIFQLMRSIKNVGASYTGERKNKGLHTKKYFYKLENIYKAKFASEGRLPLTWQVLYISGVK
jgi:malonyl-CoA O-methyltransferase